jgi:hypothetical protein
MSTLGYRDLAQLYSYKKVSITSVDPVTGAATGADANLSTYNITFGYYNPAYTAVPQVGEFWLIRKAASTWDLVSRYEESNLHVYLDQLEEGDHRIDVPGTLFISAGSVSFSDGALVNVVGGAALQFPLNFHPNNDATLNQDVLIVQGSVDTYPLFSLTQKINEGYWAMGWGPGSVPTDVNVYRNKPGTLTVDGNLEVKGTITISSSFNQAASKYAASTGGTAVRSFNPSTATTAQLGSALATLISDLGLSL